MFTEKVSVIVPCFNEEEVIHETYNRLSSVMKTSRLTNHELIFVNDGSSDNTLSILRQISKTDKSVIVVSFSRNFGHQPAVTAGLHQCSGDVAVIIDADLQDPPELIPDMISKMEQEQASVVYAVRDERKGESFFKRFTAFIFYRLINGLSEVPLPMNTGDFRLIDRKVIDAFCKLDEKNKYIRGLISWIGFKQVPITYIREPRFAGETKYPFAKMLKFATNALLYFTRKPLKIAMSLGFVSVVIGLLLTVYAVASKWLQPETTVSGWASTIIAIVFLGGVQLLTIGVIGEYIGSIFDEIKNRPQYIIDEVIQARPQSNRSVEKKAAPKRVGSV
ncbi:MAG: glycosyltransferase family 2 protein [Leptonema sp. (in: Bacteria)]|nr:glycosyltransferase family 2 protein [Leptonema sp. (in: bacteria)]